MTTALTTKRVNQPDDVHVIATTPAAMQEAQTELRGWAAAKLEAAASDVADARAAMAEAEKASMQLSPFSRRLRKAIVQFQYINKVKLAIDQGYYIVPPFPVQVFAIRTNRHRGSHAVSSYDREFEQMPVILPAGGGRYVNPVPLTEHGTYEATDKSTGAKVIKHSYYPGEFLDIEFPFTMVKPEIIEATRQALEAKIFDRLGVLPEYRSADPIIVGQIRKPTGGDWITFFVAWWLDTSTIG